MIPQSSVTVSHRLAGGTDTDLRLKDEILVVTGAIIKTLSKAEDADRTELRSFTVNDKTDICRYTLHYQSTVQSEWLLTVTGHHASKEVHYMVIIQDNLR